MNSPTPNSERLVRHLDGTLSESERAQLNDALRDDPAARRRLREIAEQAVVVADLEREADGRRSALPDRIRPTPGERPRPVAWTRPLILAIAASIVLLALGAGVFLQRTFLAREIATITALDGAVQWTGAGGRVVRNLAVGSRLEGGTIEGIEPLSWFELQFKDGTTVEITGNSTLTFSEFGQKRLHLKLGMASAAVKPQPAGRPLLFQTTSASLEVLGTQFAVEAGTGATLLGVSQGKVRIARLSDGLSVDVPAGNRTVASADEALEVRPVPPPVDRWISHLERGPEQTLGRWLSPVAGREASLAAVPFTSKPGWTLFSTAIGVSQWNTPPVALKEGASLRVRGRLAVACPLYFGVTLRHPSGAFAGRFQTIRPASEFSAGEDFDLTLPMSGFTLDPWLKAMQHKLPASPVGLIVESVWCHSLDRVAGLELVQVEIVPPGH